MNSQEDAVKLRAIARNVEKLLRACSSLGPRLQKSWDDYLTLHEEFMDNRQRCEQRQRDFAIRILKKGRLEERPRRDHEPSWDWETFRIRMPEHLAVRRTAAKSKEEQQLLEKEVAQATLEFVAWEQKVLACTTNTSRKRMWERMDRAMPMSTYVEDRVFVGFRPRAEFEVGPHPMFCNWDEFQHHPSSVKATVALVTLAVLHDVCLPNPVLAPRPRVLDKNPETARKTIVQWAVWDGLNPARGEGRSSNPPSPDPKRLSVARAEAYFSILEHEVDRLGSEGASKLGDGKDRRAQASTASSDPSAERDELLSQTEENLLTATSMLNGKSAQEPVSGEAIRRKAGYSTSGGFGASQLASLKRRGYLDSRPGFGGGYWLTAKGLTHCRGINPAH